MVGSPVLHGKGRAHEQAFERKGARAGSCPKGMVLFAHRLSAVEVEVEESLC